MRTYAAVGGGETLPSYPLKALAVVQSYLCAQGNEFRMGKRVVDEAAPSEDGDTLRIASCRPKPWDRLSTIPVDGIMYEVASSTSAPPPRRFVYVLRRKQLSSVIRGVHVYRVEEGLK